MIAHYRFIATRSPIAAKYRRVIDGLELTEGTAVTPLTSTDHRNELRQSVYRRLFGPEIVNSSPKTARKVGSPEKIKTDEDGASFLSVAVDSEGPKRTLKREIGKVDDEASFIAPILYGKKGIRTVRRPLQATPIKILDAPGLEDDFYLNLLDWEPKSNRVSVLLGGSEVYFWNASNLSTSSSINDQESTSCLGRSTQSNSDRGCVIKWSPSRSGPPLLAIGTKNGLVEIWDAEKSVRLHSWLGHSGNRCGVLSWASSGNFEGQLSSGGRDNRLVHYDLRTARGAIGHIPSAHTQEVCGLKYDHYGKQITAASHSKIIFVLGSGLLASGGNDNQLLIWDRRKDQLGPLLELNQHTAAVKAVDWSPHHAGLLASGGGTADRTIRFWNTKLPASANLNSEGASNSSNYASLKPIQASSQVCTLAWSPLASGEILSTHGFSEHNLALWSYPTGQCLGTLEGHSQRVLFQALGPDGSTVVTGSGDETLRFWSVFRRPAASEKLQFRPKSGRGMVQNAFEDVFQASR